METLNKQRRRPILISHRGNTNGPSMNMENRPDYIMRTLTLGYDVEVDVWKTGTGFLLGHDAPQYHVTEDFLHQPRLWLHAKNISALQWIQRQDRDSALGVNGFWHEADKMAMVTGGFIWTADLDVWGHNVIHMVTNANIATSLVPYYTNVMFESDLQGLCSDYIEKISFNLTENQDRLDNRS